METRQPDLVLRNQPRILIRRVIVHDSRGRVLPVRKNHFDIKDVHGVRIISVYRYPEKGAVMNIAEMLNPKKWLEGVIVTKVLGKFAKHATGAVIGFLTGPWFAKVVAPILNQVGISIDFSKFEEGMTVLLIGAFGALWNYIQHRFFKKS
jgi:hypothetical protein